LEREWKRPTDKPNNSKNQSNRWIKNVINGGIELKVDLRATAA